MDYQQASVQEAARLVRELYALVEQLEALFPGRKFTPDGHLVGSIGEVLAAYHYDMCLLAMSVQGCDANAHCGPVEIKTTQGDSVAFRCEPPHLLVLHLGRNGEVSEVFNGPGSLVWPHVGKKASNGQCSIGLSKLRRLQSQVPPNLRLSRRQTGSQPR